MQGLTIFLGGFISFFSPCILPVIPLYIGYLSGNDLTNKKKIIINTISFVLGISFAFVLLAIGFSTLGQLLSSYRTTFIKISGVLTILLGLFQLGFIKSNILSSEKKIDIKIKKMNFLVAFILGFTFSFAWTPCIGPTLTGVLFAISTTGDKIKGLILISLYTLGFILPFIITGIFSSYIIKIIRKNMEVVKYVPKVMGIMLIILGVMIYRGDINLLLTI